MLVIKSARICPCIRINNNGSSRAGKGGKEAGVSRGASREAWRVTRGIKGYLCVCAAAQLVIYERVGVCLCILYMSVCVCVALCKAKHALSVALFGRGHKIITRLATKFILLSKPAHTPTQ